MTSRLVLVSTYFLCASCGDGGGGLSGTGVSGSTSRFAIVGEYLYVLNQHEVDVDWSTVPQTVDTLDTFSIEDRAEPAWIDRLEMTLAVPETLHAVGENLFVGTTSGMQIITLASPAKPDTLSFTRHFTARDPVVVSGTTAYVTLRNSWSSIGEGQLQIYDVADLNNPQLLNTFAMNAPWGIGVRYERAYICEGSAGLQVLSVVDPLQVKKVAAVDIDVCFDVVTTDELLISTGAGGVSQYRIEAGIDAPAHLSTIGLQK